MTLISQFMMKEPNERSKCTSNLVRRTVYSEKVSSKKEQLEKAIQYCRENDCKGYQALSTGLFPLVKSPLTINMYLTQKNKSPSEAREYCSVLTVEEE